MSRLARLRSIRAAALNNGLRHLAEAGRRCDQLRDMRSRLKVLQDDVPADFALAGLKAAAACRTRLHEADRQLKLASDAAAARRGAAVEAAAALRVRVDVVDKALGR